jgi:hypothetical protein
MTEHERELLEWLYQELVLMSKLIADYEAGARKIGRIEDSRLIDETEREINDLKQRCAQIRLLIAGF